MGAQISEGAAPSSPDPLERAAQLADHYNDVGRFAEAEREALRGLATEPEDIVLLVQLARSLMGRERWDDAEESLQRLMAVQPEFAPGHFLMSIVLSQQGRFAEAEAAVLEALRIDPESEAAYEAYGDLMMRTAHYEKARALYDRARALNPEDPDLPSKIALAEIQLNRTELASRAADAGLRLGPGQALSHVSRGIAYMASGHPFRARACLREGLRLEPANTDLEEAWLEADKCCRIVYLPMYYWTIVVDRLPGKQFLVWGLVLAILFGGPKVGLPQDWALGVGIIYFVFCLYTWVSDPIVLVWKRIVPPKL